MKNLTIIIALFAFFFMFQSCVNNTEQKQEVVEVEEVDTVTLLSLGDSITNHAQQTLMANVANAMKEGGSMHAVDFCNVEAMPLTDSMANLHGVDIQRVTDKSRNPQNSLSTSMDVSVWDKINKVMASQEPDGPMQYLEEENGELFYYKSIMIAMPTCLKCHGSKNDIDENTQKLLAERYPDDKALDYEMGDLRGM